jgi:hypothetical protein
MKFVRIQWLVILLLITPISCLYAQNDKSKKKPRKKSEKCSQILNPLATSALTIKAGEIVCYAGEVHGSVGSGLSYSIEDESIVKLSYEKMQYHNKDHDKMPGADKATKTYAFKGVKSGKTKVTVNEVFRGKVENTYSFEITVQ